MNIRQRSTAIVCVFQLLLAGCAQQHEVAHSETQNNTTLRQSEVSAALPSQHMWTEGELFPKKNQTLTEASQDLESRYRLQPDREFLQAIADVYQFLSGKTVQRAEAIFENGHWTVTCAGQNVGTLSEIPDFDELHKLLVNWTDRTAQSCKFQLKPSKTENWSLKPLSKFAPVDLFASLRECDKQWQNGERTQEVMKQAADALVLLSYQQLDLMQVSDRLTSHTLSVMALSEVLCGQSSIRNQCLMADAMDDRTFAKALSLKLPEKDPLRLYLTDRTDDLKKLVAGNPSNVLSAYLLAKLLSRQGNKRAWTDYVAKQFSTNPAMTLSLIKTYQVMADGRSLISLGNLIMSETLEEIEDDRKPVHALTTDQLQWSDQLSKASLDWMMSDLLTEFETSIDKSKLSEPKQTEQSLYSGDMLESYYFGTFCSAVYLMAEAFFAMPFQRVVCEDFAKSLHAQKKGPTQELEAWVKDRIGTRTQHVSYSKLQDDMLSSQELGAPALLSVVDDLGDYNLFDDPARLIQLCRKFFTKLDGRISNRVAIAQFAQNTLLYEKLAHKLTQSAEHDGLAVNLTTDFYVRHVEDGRFINSFVSELSSAKISDERRLKILEYLQWQCFFNTGVDSKLHRRLEKEYATMVAKQPHNWQYMKQYAAFLMQFKEFDAWVENMKRWIANQPKDNANDKDSRLSLAQACYRASQYSEGLKALKKFDEDDDPDCVMLKAQLLNGMGRREEAAEWVKETLHQYPTRSELLVPAAEICWRNGEYEKAATILTSRYVTGADWEVFSSIFVRVFGDSPDKAVDAVQAMKVQGLAPHVSTLSAKAFFLNKPQLAFKIESDGLDKENASGSRLVNSYLYLKHWQGKQEAMEWLKKQVPEKRRNFVAPFAFDRFQYDLLWDFIPETPLGNDEFVWVLRAAAAVKDKELSSANREILKKHFSEGTNLYSDVGRYLLGLPRSDAIFSRQLDARDICEAAFYVGWKGFREGGDYYDDSSWLRLSVESEQSSAFEYHQAWNWLRTVQNEVANQAPGRKKNTIHSVRIDDPPSATATSNFNGACVIHVD